MSATHELDSAEEPGASAEGPPRRGRNGAAREFLTLREAAALARTTEKAIRVRAELGILPARRTVADGRIVTVVRRRDVRRLFPATRRTEGSRSDSDSAAEPGSGGPEGAAEPEPAREAALLAELRSRIHDAEEAARTAREQLLTAEREHSADRGRLEELRRSLEASQGEEARLRSELEGTRRELLSVARALGQAEGEVRRLELRPHSPEGARAASSSTNRRLGVALVVAAIVAPVLAAGWLAYGALRDRAQSLERQVGTLEAGQQSATQAALQLAEQATGDRDRLRAELARRDFERVLPAVGRTSLLALFGQADR